MKVLVTTMEKESQDWQYTRWHKVPSQFGSAFIEKFGASPRYWLVQDENDKLIASAITNEEIADHICDLHNAWRL